MTLALVTYPHKALTTVCAPVPEEWFKGDASTTFLKQIVEIANVCNRNRGIALAANQVGLLYRFIVILPHPQLKDCCVGSDGQSIITPSVIVNPIIHQIDIPEQQQVSIKEGCLSFPDLLLPITRPSKIAVSWTDNVGKPFTATLSGLLARVVQHETDHLDGELFIDKLTPFARGKFQDRINKLRRK